MAETVVAIETPFYIYIYIYIYIYQNIRGRISKQNLQLNPVDNPLFVSCHHIELISDKSVATQNLCIFELLVQKETSADALLTGTVS